MIWGSIVEISVTVYRNLLALFWFKKVKNLLHYQDLTANFVKMYKICKHGKLSQNRSHMVFKMWADYPAVQLQDGLSFVQWLERSKQFLIVLNRR